MSAPTITFTLADDQGVETTHTLPAKYEVCDRCQGNGTHVNPAIDGNGISAEEFDEDPDFAERYVAGHYDVSCETCQGLRVVPVVDEDRCDSTLLAAYERQQDDEARYQSMVAAERRAEMRACGEW